MEDSMAIVMNYPCYVELLDSMLRRRHKKNKKASILQQHLFFTLISFETIAIIYLPSMLHISVCMPFRWLAEKKYELKRHQ